MSAASPDARTPTGDLSWVRVTPTGVELEVLVAPRASRSKIVGVHDGRLKIQLAAPPVDGAANEALQDVLASALKVARRSVTLVRGETSRRKTIGVTGVSLSEARSLAEEAS